MDTAIFAYQDVDGTYVRVECGFFNRKCTTSKGIRNVLHYGVKIYSRDKGSKRMSLYDTFWLHTDEAAVMFQDLEHRLRELAGQCLNPEDLHEELDGYIEEMKPDFEFRHRKKDPSFFSLGEIIAYEQYLRRENLASSD